MMRIDYFMTHAQRNCDNPSRHSHKRLVHPGNRLPGANLLDATQRKDTQRKPRGPRIMKFRFLQSILDLIVLHLANQ
jgi:hypothetical protein